MIKPFIGYPLTVNLFGLGRIQEEDNETYFIVSTSPDAAKVRNQLGLNIQDFHVTVGFKKRDIFDQPKDFSTLLFPFDVIEKHQSNKKLRNHHVK